MIGFVSVDAFSLGVAFALVSAFFWAAYDIARKQLGSSMTASAAVVGVMLFHAPFIAPFIGATEFYGWSGGGHPLGDVLLVGIPATTGEYWVLAGLSVVLNLVANFLFLRAVQISPLSLTIPYLAFTPIFSAVPAYFVYTEVPSWWGLAGILTVCLGAFFLNPGNREHGWSAPLRALWSERGSLYMLVVAALWSITPVFDKGAAAMTSPMWHTLVLSSGVAATFIAFRGVIDRGLASVAGEVWRDPGWVAASGLFAVAAMVLQLAAYDFIDVAYVETIKRAVGVMGAIVAGWMFFDESDILRRLAAAAVMTAGVVMVIFGG